MPTSGPYECARCGLRFMSERSDGDALDETRATFGFIPPEHERATLCPECYAEFVAWAKAQGHTV